MKKENDSKEWLRLPVAAIQDKDLSASDVYVLAYVLDRVDGDTKAVSIKSIAAKTMLSERQVKRCLKNLVENKYIKAESRAGKPTLYSQCDVLQPKRQPQKKKSGLDIEKYKIFINDIPELTPEQEERIRLHEEEIQRRKSQ